MASLLHDTPVGLLLRLCFGKGFMSFPDEAEGFAPTFDSTSLPQQSLKRVATNPSTMISAAASSHNLDVEKDGDKEEQIQTDVDSELQTVEPELHAPLSRHETRLVEAARSMSSDHVLVTWYNNSDPENPRNWSAGKKRWVASIICLYTFAVYFASSVVVPSEYYIIVKYNVSITAASLSLAIYVLGYALGPMVFSPLSEIAILGRNTPYWLTYFLYLVVSVIVAVVDKFAAFLVFRFIQGFLGSPILATGAASMDDIYDWTGFPYAMMFWVGSMYLGPAVGPLLGGYAVSSNWRWPLWEIVILAGIVALLLPLLPETSSYNILLRRARRLRQSQNNAAYRASSELVKLSPAAMLTEAMIKPAQIAILDPAIGFTAVYSAVVYGTYYSFFEAFPIVFADKHHFGLGSIGLVFLVVVVGVGITAPMYAAWLKWWYIPRGKKLGSAFLLNYEKRMIPAMVATWFLPVGLFLFAWTGRTASIHWIVPTIGIGIFAGSSFVVFQSILTYISDVYPRYVASLFASNDFMRGMTASGFVVFSRAMYLNLGIGAGVSLLGGLSFIGVAGAWVLYFFGAAMRKRSKFAEK